MLRSHKVILVSHCVLNQNAVVRPLAREKGAFKVVINMLMAHDFGIVQLSCPETLMYGMHRPPMSKEAYDTPEYITLCTELADREREMVQRLVSGDITVAGIIGIDQSPTCSQFGEKGHFMHALDRFEVISNLPKIDIPETYEIGTKEADAFHEVLNTWLIKLHGDF